MAFPSDLSRTKNWGSEILTDADLEGQLDLIVAWIMAAMNSSTGHSHDGTSNQSQKIPLGSLIIASQAQGDVIYASSATAWTRLGAGTAGQFLKTQGAAANPVWASALSPNYRYETNIMQASTTTLTVGPGSVEVNGAIITKTANTTLTVSTAGDWAGGVSLRATNATAYVGIDSSGNLKMHTTAPSHGDYALTITAANNTKRYVAWSGTTYRVIGWFRMNGTGAGELDTYGVSNIADMGVRNIVTFQTGAVATGTTTVPNDDTIPQNTEGDQYMSLNFVPTNTNNKLRITTKLWIASSGSTNKTIVALFQDSTANALAAQSGGAIGSASVAHPAVLTYEMKAGTTSLTTFKVRMGGPDAVTYTFNGEAGARLLGGVINSFISVEEIESQLT